VIGGRLVTLGNFAGVTKRDGKGGRVEAHGHRGARGLRPENTLPGFAHAFEIGVDAVELDVGLTADGVVILNHDQVLSALTCCDTEPAWPDDPQFPYVGRKLRELTLDQIRTVDAGVRQASADGWPADTDPLVLTQLPMRGVVLPTLAEVCELLDGYDSRRIHLAVELKTDPSWPYCDVEHFVAAVADVLESCGMSRRARLLGFDWRVLTAAARVAPRLRRVALVEEKTLTVSDGSGAPWLAGLDPSDWVAGAVAIGANVLSPEHTLISPELVGDAHSLSLPVTAWTVNDTADMARLIEYGVDAIVTDYPDRLRIVMQSQGRALPRPARIRKPARTL
jgi:glycerophosphoryl diester phosphodiesterase